MLNDNNTMIITIIMHIKIVFQQNSHYTPLLIAVLPNMSKNALVAESYTGNDAKNLSRLE